MDVSLCWMDSLLNSACESEFMCHDIDRYLVPFERNKLGWVKIFFWVGTVSDPSCSFLHVGLLPPASIVQ